jgi:predicted TIM-barrel fold metal-dependent hydrolase
MIIDVHTHLGKWYFPIRELTVSDMLAYMERGGIGTSIISSSLAIIYDFREGNRELAEAIRGHNQLLGYVTVNLNYPRESLQELERYLRNGFTRNDQFVGVKVHPLSSRHRYDTPEGMALTRAVADYNVPILVHTFGSALESPWNVVPAAKANPDVPIILAHMGGDAWWEGVRAAQESANLYLEICSTWTDPEKVRAGIDAVGAERVLFGTDATLFDAAYTLGALEDAGLSHAERDLIMEENAKRLFNLP